MMSKRQMPPIQTDFPSFSTSVSLPLLLLQAESSTVFGGNRDVGTALKKNKIRWPQYVARERMQRQLCAYAEKDPFSTF